MSQNVTHSNTTFFPNGSILLVEEGDNVDDGCSVQHIVYTPPAQVVFSILYAVIFCCGTFGNMLVSAAVIRSQQVNCLYIAKKGSRLFLKPIRRAR